MATIEQLRIQASERLKKLKGEREELKARKQQVLDDLEADGEYIDLKEKAKEAAKRLSAHKQALLNEPQNRKLVEDIKDANKEIKDLQALLSGELLAFNRTANSFQMETTDGQLHNIQIKAKLVPTDQPTLI